MRQLIRRLEEAAPAPGSKEWLAGVKKWWGQWVKDAERVSKIRDPKDRKVVLAWFADGEKRIEALKDALVRAPGFLTIHDLATSAMDKISGLGMGSSALKLPAKVMGIPLSQAPEMKVLPYLETALKRLRVYARAEESWFQRDYPMTPADLRAQAMMGGASRDMYGRHGDLNSWQAGVESLDEAVAEIDRDMQSVFRTFTQIAKNTLKDVERDMEKSVPLEYSIGRVKVITDPGSASDLMKSAMAAQGTSGQHGVDVQLSRMVLNGLQMAQRILQQRGFGDLWYGNVYVLSEYQGNESTKRKTKEHFKSSGHYKIGGDNVVINPGHHWQESDVIGLMVHELAHRYWFKNMKAGARARFAAWFDPRGKEQQDAEGPKFDYVPAPTSYAAEEPAEEFAETFAAYVMGSYKGISLTGPQKARFEALALGRAAQSEDDDGDFGAFLWSIQDA